MYGSIDHNKGPMIPSRYGLHGVGTQKRENSALLGSRQTSEGDAGSRRGSSGYL